MLFLGYFSSVYSLFILPSLILPLCSLPYRPVIPISPLLRSPQLLKRDFKHLALVIEDKSLGMRPNGIIIEVKESASSVKLFESQQNWISLWVEVIEFWKEFFFDGSKYHWKDWELFDNDPGESGVGPHLSGIKSTSTPLMQKPAVSFNLCPRAPCAYFYHCSYYTVPQWLIYFVSTTRLCFQGQSL